MPHLLALAASFRTGSLNRRLLAVAVNQAKQAGATVTELDYAACDAPLYHEELAGEQLPPGAKTLADALLQCDGLLLASPEYNWSMPGSLKNLIDWLSIDSRAPLHGKTALLMCASPSTRGGITGLLQLRVPLEHLGMWVYPHVVGVGDGEKNLQTGNLLTPKDESYLNTCVADFVRKTAAVGHVG